MSRASNTGGSDLWSNTLPLDHGDALTISGERLITNVLTQKIYIKQLLLFFWIVNDRYYKSYYVLSIYFSYERMILL